MSKLWGKLKQYEGYFFVFMPISLIRRLEESLRGGHKKSEATASLLYKLITFYFLGAAAAVAAIPNLVLTKARISSPPSKYTTPG